MSALKKMMQVRMALQATKIKETGRNTFSNYDYLQLADFLPVAQKLCAEAGLCGVVSFTADIASLTLTDLDDESSQIVITSPMGSAALKGCHEVQNVGAVETYQRRYLWVTALEIVEHDALDSAPRNEPEQPNPRPSKPAAAEAEEVMPDARVLDWIATVNDQQTGATVKEILAEAKQACINLQSPKAYARIKAAAEARVASIKAAQKG